MKAKKLYGSAGPDFALPKAVSRDGFIHSVEAPDLPMLHMPNGKPLFEANYFIVEKFLAGDAISTLHQYSTQLSHLIRYCFYNKIYFHTITDAEFTFFIHTLTGERENNELVRTSTTVIKIGLIALDFLTTVGKIHHLKNFVAPGGTIDVKVEQKKIRLNTKSSKSVTAISHHSFPLHSTFKRRLAISFERIDRLISAIYMSSSSIYILKRRLITVRLLEITGGRRSEVVRIKTQDVLNANKSYPHFLKLNTGKRRDGAIRFIEISKSDMHLLMEFIEINLSTFAEDRGIDCAASSLLLSETTGKPLQANTITSEIHELAKIAKIKEVTCPHMFRHRFLTKYAVALLEAHNITSKDDFTRSLLDIEGIKRRLMEVGGHRSPDSLDIYLHLAIDELSGYVQTLDILRVSAEMEGIEFSLKALLKDVSNGLATEDTLKKIQEMIGSIEALRSTPKL